ncbi:MAG: hypothetical protein KDK04_13015, partial [Candidatus Competibacteraceae bacterium]|nr:hypothetical protein [Candidatus Competibacteraceae bacterium]
MWEKFFFDIPVYRVSLKEYERDKAKYIEESMYGTPPNIDQQMKAFHEREPSIKQQFENHLIRQGDCMKI